MRGFTAIDEFLDSNAEPIDPSTLQYLAVPAWVIVNDKKPERACHGCMFEGQRYGICAEASRLAVTAGIKDCEELDAETGRTSIYVKAEIDVRQLTIEE